MCIKFNALSGGARAYRQGSSSIGKATALSIESADKIARQSTEWQVKAQVHTAAVVLGHSLLPRSGPSRSMGRLAECNGRQVVVVAQAAETAAPCGPHQRRDPLFPGGGEERSEGRKSRQICLLRRRLGWSLIEINVHQCAQGVINGSRRLVLIIWRRASE